MKTSCQNGFLLLEVLVAGLILTAGIASAMYLFRTGFESLERTERVNLLSSKLLQAGSLLKFIDLEKQSGTEDLGDGVAMKWKAQLLVRPRSEGFAYDPDREGIVKVSYMHLLSLYRIDFSLEYQGVKEDYRTNVFRSRAEFWR